VRAARQPSPPSEIEPAREDTALKNTPAVPTLPQHEVNVQWDTPMADYIMIYQYRDQQSGALILQMPNEQILSLVHQIQQMLQSTQRQASAASAAAVRDVTG
jgi:hypothetical protein